MRRRSTAAAVQHGDPHVKLVLLGSALSHSYICCGTGSVGSVRPWCGVQARTVRWCRTFGSGDSRHGRRSSWTTEVREMLLCQGRHPASLWSISWWMWYRRCWRWDMGHFSPTSTQEWGGNTPAHPGGGRWRWHHLLAKCCWWTSRNTDVQWTPTNTAPRLKVCDRPSGQNVSVV